ncbi:uncharacterized protein PHALS_13478 [Plasmopara halstedii]|uniref:Uncharacterized protein n=1 Tax=Plasmopara halstedii TaxID=4781 RepID=A0A0P1APP3_PLAHL|nr:uncharacterized protein PHALS_13478 [Plasmopara halstedii]CEG43273.1 hypothetical protein PHALS_13478 [Plasmopara halstedii]|eukprot:XP_024579642.1 hypothetical protein PHALS_13478 [Plasmopara halstedii]
MKVFGQSTFDMFADPTVLDNEKDVLYDVFTTFTNAGIDYNYKFINGSVIIESTPANSESLNKRFSPCLDTELNKIPDINSIVAAINVAKRSNANSCIAGISYKAEKKGETYTVCALPTGFMIHGVNMDVLVEYIWNRTKIQPPTLDSSVHKCSSVASYISTTEVGRAMLTGQSYLTNTTRKLRAEVSWIFGSKDLPTCSCKSTPRPCIFIHGLGCSPELAENQDEFHKYWGDLTGHTPCCSSIKFARLDTVNFAWTDQTLQQKLCDRVLAVSDTSTDSRITDTIIVTHSMGNLILAGAIANGRCKLESSSTWVGMSGPMKGSMASDIIQESCAGNSNFVYDKLAKIIGKCPPTEALKSLAYEGGSFCSEELDAAYKAAQKVYREQVYALSCSENYFGLWSKYQAQFWIVAQMIPHKSSKNDGFVEFQSCAAEIPDSRFGSSYLDRFYRNSLNHFDMRFLAGDSSRSKSKMPLKWFECLL